MNQEEADQDVADEVSEEVDSRGEVMHDIFYGLSATTCFVGGFNWAVSSLACLDS